MVYIHTPIMVPDTSTTQTRHSRELAQRVDEAIREFKREYPDLTEDEIRAALAETTSQHGGRPMGRRRPAVAVAVGLAAALFAGVLSAVGGGERVASSGGSAIWAIVAGVLVVAIGLVGVLVAIRR